MIFTCFLKMKRRKMQRKCVVHAFTKFIAQLHTRKTIGVETIKKCKCCDFFVYVVTFLYDTRRIFCDMVMVEYNSC